MRGGVAIFPISTDPDAPELSVRRWRGLGRPLAFALCPRALTAERGPGGSDATWEWAQVALSDHPLFADLIASKSKVAAVFSHWVMSNSLPPHGLQHARLPCPPLSPGVRSKSCPLSQWCSPRTKLGVLKLQWACDSEPLKPQLFEKGRKWVILSCQFLGDGQKFI